MRRRRRGIRLDLASIRSICSGMWWTLMILIVLRLIMLWRGRLGWLWMWFRIRLVILIGRGERHGHGHLHVNYIFLLFLSFRLRERKLISIWNGRTSIFFLIECFFHNLNLNLHIFNSFLLGHTFSSLHQLLFAFASTQWGSLSFVLLFLLFYSVFWKLNLHKMKLTSSLKETISLYFLSITWVCYCCCKL